MIIAVIFLAVILGGSAVSCFQNRFPVHGVVLVIATLGLGAWVITAAVVGKTVEAEKVFTIQALALTNEKAHNVVMDGDEVIELDSISVLVDFELNLDGYKIRRTTHSPWRAGIHCIEGEVEWTLLGTEAKDG